MNHKAETEYNFLNSVRYADQIKRLSASIKSTVGFSNFCICIIDNLTAEKYMLSNMPDWAVEYYKLGGYRSDKVFCKEYVKGKREFFPRLDDYDYIQDILVKKEEGVYGYFDLYALVRTCYECTFILLAADKDSSLDSKKIFYETRGKFERFIIDFLSRMSDEILESCAFSDRLSLLYNNKYLSKIMLSPDLNTDLTDTEKKVLAYFKDKSSPKEMALKLDLSERTIRNNILSLKEKLEVFSTRDLSREAFIYDFG